MQACSSWMACWRAILSPSSADPFSQMPSTCKARVPPKPQPSLPEGFYFTSSNDTDVFVVNVFLEPSTNTILAPGNATVHKRRTSYFG
jgi:hypothetical protein